MLDINAFNRNLVEEFRATGGKVSGQFVNAPLLLLTTIGAKSGQARIAPVVYTTDGDHLIIIASKGGAPTHPDWYHNLVASPTVTVEVGSERFQAQAETAEGEERERLFNQMGAKMRNFADYQRNTGRQLAVVGLKRFRRGKSLFRRVHSC